jgi:GAF domain-containing protein
MKTIEEENRRLAGRYGAIEKQSNNLMNLYVASYRLHGTLDRQELMATIQEIVANLIGCEEMALFELDREDRRLELVTSVGIDPDPIRSIPADRGVIGRTVLEGQKVVPGPADDPERVDGEEGLTASIPLLLDGQVNGAIALYRLLPQKVAGYEEIDFELMDLLATHAATALHCTALHDRHREASCR